MIITLSACDTLAKGGFQCDYGDDDDSIHILFVEEIYIIASTAARIDDNDSIQIC